MLNIFFLGLISFFTDISTEMLYPLVPLYLTSAFGASPALIGVIEGIAESVASLIKVFSGYVSDKFRKKKALAFLGYSGGIFYKFALLFAGSWVGILSARVIDRIGKGIRVAPRDSLVSDSAGEGDMGKAFGLHKALDMAGAAGGILITFFLLAGAKGDIDYKKIFLFSLIPAVIGLAMFAFVKEKKVPRETVRREHFWKNAKNINGQIKLYLVVVFLFTLGNSSNTFLLLRAKTVGFDDSLAVLLYFIYHAAAAALSLPFGRLSDKIGRKKLLVSGYLVFAAVYLGFAFAFNQPFLVLMFVMYGAYTAMTTGVERAYIAEIAPPELKGTMLGLQSTVAGIALLPASIIAGALWNAFGAAVPFIFGAVLSLAAAFVLMVFMRDAKRAG
ncbi:MAG: MFS transporter [Oscillospiraceae bacterium]|nr:MFS transporter [Oscillospiraceae bacterium]